MDIMNQSTNDHDEYEEEMLDPRINDALKRMDSIMAVPSAESDIAIISRGKVQMAMIRRRSAMNWALVGIGAIAASVALAILLPHLAVPSAISSPQITSHEDSAAIILKEVSAVFPGQIQSIQRDKSGLQLSLADVPSENLGQAVVLEIQKNGNLREIISFSGQAVEIMGRKVNIHANHDGHIHLKGPGIEWQSEHPVPPLPDLQIRARLI